MINDSNNHGRNDGMDNGMHCYWGELYILIFFDARFNFHKFLEKLSYSIEKLKL